MSISDTKLRIQNEFRQRIGLSVEQPGLGFRSSNDGNTARRFFQNITKIHLELIKRLHVILITVSSSNEIDKIQGVFSGISSYYINSLFMGRR